MPDQPRRMSDISNVSFTVKELLVDLKADVRAIDAKLDLKADRERVHDIANDLAAMKLLNASAPSPLDFKEAKDRITNLEAWRNRLLGAFVVATPLVGLISGFVARHYG